MLCMRFHRAKGHSAKMWVSTKSDQTITFELVKRQSINKKFHRLKPAMTRAAARFDLNHKKRVK
ncbi:hypothetical protein CGQ17_22290 [Enterobacter cloacae]|nr:hypothetical protein CGQ17_22290 [Enterobacter cloacae]